MPDLRAVICAVFIGFASAGSPLVLAQSTASPGALPVPSGGLPLQQIKGGPVSPPSIDPRNFEGVWTPAQGLFGTYAPQNPTLPLMPEAQKRVKRYLDLSASGQHVATPHLTCRPTGVQGMTLLKFPVVVVQTPAKIFFLMQEDRDVYQVFLNRGHPADLKPSYNGDAVGRWEGNTLVVDIVGYNGWGFINEEAWDPTSEQMHMVQRFTKSADGRELNIETTLTDPKLYSKPFTLRQRWLWASGTRQVEYDCSEYPPDTSVRMVYENKIFRPVCTTVLSDASEEKIACEKTGGLAQAPSSISKEQWNAAERSAVEVVTRWVEAWASKDAERVGAIMDERCEYRLDPSQPVKRGRAEFVADVKMFIGGMSSMKITEVHAVGSELNVAVLLERVDDFTLRGKRRAVPVATVFHVRDGKIVQLLDIPLVDLGADASGPPPGAAPL